ncbi:MAG: GNAT family N-acetyltransferase [Pseudomonadales bacterium]|nr:GNAT family N-acetyltransferase [Pseudomonadales bacterium]
MSDASIHIFASSEWQVYRTLRLQALQDAPDAFGSTYEEAIDRPDQYWISRLENLAPSRDLPLRADCENRPAGLAWGQIEASQPVTAQVFQMWVAPEFRGLGIGRRLLMEIIRWARAQGAGSVRLGVTLGNRIATDLYTSTGFEAIGSPVPIRPNRNLLVQDMQLQLGGAERVTGRMNDQDGQ